MEASSFSWLLNARNLDGESSLDLPRSASFGNPVEPVRIGVRAEEAEEAERLRPHRLRSRRPPRARGGERRRLDEQRAGTIVWLADFGEPRGRAFRRGHRRGEATLGE